MEILKKIEEDRRWDEPQKNSELIELLKYLNGLKLYDQLPMMSTKKEIRIDYIRRFSIFVVDDVIMYEIRYDGSSALGQSGKGITRTIPPNMMQPYIRMMKLKNIMK